MLGRVLDGVVGRLLLGEVGGVVPVGVPVGCQLLGALVGWPVGVQVGVVGMFV